MLNRFADALRSEDDETQMTFLHVARTFDSAVKNLAF